MSFSYMACNNPTANCYYNELINTDKYFEHIYTITGANDAETLKLRNKYICGTNTDNFAIQECCLKNDQTNTKLVDDKLIKIMRDANGTITDYRVCNCGNKICEEKVCKDFKKPTEYEACKARTADPKNREEISSFEYKISVNNSFPDCYSKCK